MSIKPIGVANPSFTLDANARDCPPLQFLREFTLNGWQAIDARVAMRLHGDEAIRHSITWRQFTELSGRARAPKLACIDTGTGMTGEEMERYINSLASSGRVQGLGENYGLGAKVAGAVVSPAGMTYLGWTDGPDSGVVCTLMNEPGSGWGLALDPITLDATRPADPSLCPPEIRDAGWRGTVVVLHGRNEEHDTTLPPSNELGADWLLKTLNTRFYELPEHIEVRCQGPGKGGIARGQRALLDPHTEAHGTVRLTDATVYWRILEQDRNRRRGKRGSRFAASGHRAALHNGELYELRTASSGGYRKLQEFGITLGYNRVVIYAEPDHAQPNTVRSRLVIPDAIEEKELPWDRWAEEFEENMPQELRELVECAISEDAGQDRRDLMRRLRAITEELPIPVYRRADEGADHAAALTHSGPEHDPDARTAAGGDGRRPGSQPSTASRGNLVSLFARPDGPDAQRFDSQQIPDIRCGWVSVAAGTRVPPVLEDMAATFLKRQSLVQLSEDFRGYVAVLGYFRARYATVPAHAPMVVAEVKAACQELVIEFIVGVLRLRSAPYWTPDAEEHALDDRSLTGCLMQHPTLVTRIEERLARRLRKAA
jgi:hypothetical protein